MSQGHKNMLEYEILHVEPGEDAEACLTFRHDLPFVQQKGLPTGYDTSWKTRRQANYLCSTLYGLADELLLDIMKNLEAPDLYIIRQVSHRFFQLFEDATFSKYNLKINIDPEQAKPTMPWQLRLAREAQGLEAPDPHFIPGFVFKRTALRSSEKMRLRNILLKERLCTKCIEHFEDSGLRLIMYRFGDGDEMIMCPACRSKHFPHWFHHSQQVPQDRLCIGWEGRVRICPHRWISWSTTQSWAQAPADHDEPFFKCDKCADAFGLNGEPPTITRGDASAVSSSGELALAWKAPIDILKKGELVVKDHLRKRLESFNREHPGLLCSHVSFDTEKLIKVFHWYRCLCFREPSAWSCRCHSSDKITQEADCCDKDLDADPEERVGMFPISEGDGGSGHGTSCAYCGYHYEWTSDGQHIFLAGRFSDIGETTGPIPDESKQLALGTRSITSRWLSRLDPASYEEDEGFRHERWCHDARCLNSTNSRRW